ncbi:hypothetical protein J437_LFUL009507 [Ladona fulva]|uniref:Cytochrome P450 n=1 Tax=Ladona fulva TaxID=123851 RepID=A0A8K0NYP6_LADFU|nr:hypothetical protein J437_LFUL009507 [Ladona fulva]
MDTESLKATMESLAGMLIFSIAVIPLLVVFLASVFFLIPTVMLYTTRKGRRVRKLINSIPGPPALPIVGNTLDFWVSRERILHYRRENAVKYYPMYRLWFFDEPMVNPIDPEYIKAVLHSSKHIEKGFLYKLLHPWLGSGLLTSKGEKWFSHRKLLTPTFHFKILEEFVPMFAERSAALAERLYGDAVSGKAIDIVPVISQCTLDIICESAMGIKLDRKDEVQRRYIEAIYGFGEVFYYRAIKPWYNVDWMFNFTPLARKHKELIHILHSFTNKVIQDKKRDYQERKLVQLEKKQPEKKRVKAFLELLLEASMQENNLLTDEEIREEVDTFMFEGHDTTSMTICWTMFTLATHPEIQVPAGTTVNLAINGIHMNPSIYPEPEVFDPDRFLPEAVRERHPYAYIPFSAGPRNCIGQRFAMLEVKAVLSALIQRYKLKPFDEQKDVTFMHDLVLRPSGGIKIQLEPRVKA